MSVEENGVVFSKKKRAERTEAAGLFTDLRCVAKVLSVRRVLFAALLGRRRPRIRQRKRRNVLD